MNKKSENLPFGFNMKLNHLGNLANTCARHTETLDVYTGFSVHGNSIHNIIPLLKKEKVHL